MNSLFRNLLKVISKGQVPLEDFFTEIIAYLLKSHRIILEEFLKFFSLSRIEGWQEAFVKTQETLPALAHHSVDSRPDMYIVLSNNTVKEMLLIESKIDAEEGDNQLKRYAEHLDHQREFDWGTLVYITRDYDKKEPGEIFKDCQHVHKLQFIQLRWYQIYAFLKNWSDNFLVQEVLTFMEVMNMALNNQFNMIDILALTNFPRVQKMMEETLSGVVREELSKVLQQVSQSSVSMTQLKERNRYILVSQQKDWFWCGLGYWIDPSNMANYPDIVVHIEVPPNHVQRQNVLKIMEEIVAQGKWQGGNLNDPKAWSYIFQRCSLQHFISEEDHIKSIQKQFLSWIEDIKAVKNNYPEMPWQ